MTDDSDEDASDEKKVCKVSKGFFHAWETAPQMRNVFMLEKLFYAWGAWF